MHAAEVSRHVDLADAFQVADTSIHHQAAALGGPHDVMEEIVADDGAAFLLSVDVHHQDVAGLQHVDHGLVPQVVDAFGAGLVVHHGVQVGARRHESHGDGPADHFLGGMENLPAAGVLAVGVAAAATRALGGAAFSRRRSAVGPIDDELFTGKAARAFQQAVGNLGTPVGEAISGPGWRVFDHLLAGPGPQLCVGGRGRQNGQSPGAQSERHVAEISVANHGEYYPPSGVNLDGSLLPPSSCSRAGPRSARGPIAWWVQNSRCRAADAAGPPPRSE